MKPSIQFVRRKDDVQIAYCVFGQGPPFVYPAAWVTNLPFFLEDTAAFEFLSLLAKKLTVICYDKHGCGQSDRNREEFSLETELLDLETIIDHLGLEKVALFGSSLAGPVSIVYALRNAEKVSRLILYGTWADGNRIANQEVRSALIALIEASWGLGSRTLTDIFVPRATKEIHLRLAQFQRDACSPNTAARLLESGYSFDVSSFLAQLTVPTLVLHREGDKAAPVSQGKQLAMGIPSARFKVLRGDIHIPWLGDSAEIAEEILSFLQLDESRNATLPNGDSAAERPAAAMPTTIMFTDMVSSTDLVTKIGDEAARDLFLKHDQMIREQLRKHGGKELQNLGDGFMLSFESATAAIRCACAIQKALSERLPLIRVRIGINTGEVVMREGQHPFGQAVVAASRIASRAKGEQIFISDVTRQLVSGSRLYFVEQGRFKPKGFAGSIKIHEVIWKK